MQTKLFANTLGGGSAPLTRRAAGAPEATPEQAPAPAVGAALAPLPPGAPEWKRKAYDLAYSLAQLAAGPDQLAPHVACAVERVTEAWYAGGVSSQDIARVARLVERAHEAIRATTPQQLQASYVLCAQVIVRGLPRELRQRVPVPLAVEVVQELSREPIASLARRAGTMRLLGWSQTADRWADELVQMSLQVC